jgi:hypothetical protein
MQEEEIQTPKPPEPKPLSFSVPGWLLKENTGLGEALKKLTRRVGIEPCHGCNERAAALDRRVVFTRR